MLRKAGIHKDRTLFWKARERSPTRSEQSPLSEAAKRLNKRKVGIEPLDVATWTQLQTSAR